MVLPHGGRVCRRPSFEKPDYVSSQAFLFYIGLEKDVGANGNWPSYMIHIVSVHPPQKSKEAKQQKSIPKKNNLQKIGLIPDTYRIAVKYLDKRYTTKKQRSKTTKKP